MSDTTTHDVMVAQTEKAGVLLDYFQGHRDALEADRVAHGQAVAAQLGNLKNLIRTEMYFSGTVDPNEATPTNVDGGTFSSINTLLNTAPPGAFVDIILLSDATYVIDSNLFTYATSLSFRQTGAGAKPILQLVGFASGAFNSLYTLRPLGVSHVQLTNVVIQFPTAKPDPALPWASDRTLVRYALAGPTSCGMVGCLVTGTLDHGVVSANAGATNLQMYNCTLDGVYGVASGQGGISLIGATGVTLQNSAALIEGGTLGETYLLA